LVEGIRSPADDAAHGSEPILVGEGHAVLGSRADARGVDTRWRDTLVVSRSAEGHDATDIGNGCIRIVGDAQRETITQRYIAEQPKILAGVERNVTVHLEGLRPFGPLGGLFDPQDAAPGENDLADARRLAHRKALATQPDEVAGHS
jgi:hypothetical protein